MPVKARAPVGLWIRHRDHVDLMRERDNWSEFLRAGRAEYGSVVGKLFAAGHFDQHHCAAARIYAEIMGRRDRYHQVKDPKVQGSPRSPSYERGFGKDDEIERRIQQGTIASYERQARRAQRAGAKLDALIVNETARAVLDAVCVQDQTPSTTQIPDLKAQLDIIWDVFKHRYQRQDDGKVRTWRREKDARDHPFLGAGAAGVAGEVEGDAGAAAAEPTAQ